MNIHLGWIGASVPDHANDAFARIRSLNPTESIHFWTDSSAICGEWRQAFDSVAFSPHLQSDILRHAVLRKHGGLWLDVDVVTTVQAATLTRGWNTYTAVRLAPSPFIGTDVLYVPPKWDGWRFFDAYIASVNLLPPVSGLVLAHQMIESVRLAGCPVTVVDNPGLFPCIQQHWSTAAMALRCGVVAPKAGLGDMVADGLAAVGITKERVQSVAAKVGIKDCGCAKRQQAANRLGAKLGLPPGRAS